jgi:hypothetical protein
MIYAIYINGVYKRCAQGTDKKSAIDQALASGMSLRISDKLVLLPTKLADDNSNNNSSNL